MVSGNRYLPEIVLIGAVCIVSVLGFWPLYFGPDASPQPRHHLHLVTAFLWLALLVTQLTLIVRGRFASHRKIGLGVLLAAPLVVASTAALSVISAQRALAAGEPDGLIVQNVIVTFELGLMIALAFLYRRNRALHGSFLLSTAILFGGIALFFALLGFVPIFRIEGPETFYRFGMAALTGQAICLAAGAVMFATAPKIRWPYLLAAGFFMINTAIDQVLLALGLEYAATGMVGRLDEGLAFVAAFVLQLGLLAFILFPQRRQPARSTP